jgi:hypothetical protein
MEPWVVDLVMIAVIVGWALQAASVAISVAELVRFMRSASGLWKAGS